MRPADIGPELQIFKGEKPTWFNDGTRVFYDPPATVRPAAASAASTTLPVDREDRLMVYDFQNRTHIRTAQQGQRYRGLVPSFQGTDDYLRISSGKINIYNAKTDRGEDLVSGSSPQWIDQDTFLYAEGQSLRSFSFSKRSSFVVIPDHFKTFHYSHGRLAYSTVTGTLATAEPSVVFNSSDVGSTVGKADLLVFNYSRKNSEVVYTLPHVVGQRAD